MRKELPIDTAPRDGSKITVIWMDEDDQRNESIAQYRSLERLRASGGDWDETDAGWWVFIDSKRQQKIDPILWVSETEDDEESD
ncbi:hypothetical protein DKP76_11895 [Falsochrobactrum shanghaiense]|uniref:Uncharacterized protein n=1 Tax=Falsochrobactrum shanghaiense TaxID=2201899 RepID=A0A316J8H1_9HYPH|nr:hypothetical protein [Falsochrobactrum shanghaiense]PWL17468.1 hypothetical protein DKP76_11895 [Falsochrobactrum shanghaiense]